MIGRELSNGPRRPVGLAQRAAERAVLREAFFQEFAGPALVLNAAAEPVRASARHALDGLAGTGPRRAGGGGQPAAAVRDGRAGAVARDNLDTSQAGLCLRCAQLVYAGAGAAAVFRCCFCTGECCCQQGCEQWHVCEGCLRPAALAGGRSDAR